MKRLHETARETVGLRPEEVRNLRKLLLARKAELMDSYSTLEDEARQKGKADAFEQTLSLALLENESSAIREIDSALERMDEGAYGVCEECARSIDKARLRAFPQATLCRRCKSLEEGSRN